MVIVRSGFWPPESGDTRGSGDGTHGLHEGCGDWPRGDGLIHRQHRTGVEADQADPGISKTQRGNGHAVGSSRAWFCPLTNLPDCGGENDRADQAGPGTKGSEHIEERQVQWKPISLSQPTFHLPHSADWDVRADRPEPTRTPQKALNLMRSATRPETIVAAVAAKATWKIEVNCWNQGAVRDPSPGVTVRIKEDALVKEQPAAITALRTFDRVANEPVGRCGKCKKTIRFLSRMLDGILTAGTSRPSTMAKPRIHENDEGFAATKMKTGVDQEGWCQLWAISAGMGPKKIWKTPSPRGRGEYRPARSGCPDLFKTLDAAKTAGMGIEQAVVLFSRRGLWAGEEAWRATVMERLIRRGRHVDIATLKKASHLAKSCSQVCPFLRSAFGYRSLKFFVSWLLIWDLRSTAPPPARVTGAVGFEG